MTEVVTGIALYLRNMHPPHTPTLRVERAAADLAKRLKRIGMSWVAIGGVWQEAGSSSFMNSPEECAIYRKAFHDVDMAVYVWGYPWVGQEQHFVDGMFECAGDEPLFLLDPELGMNPSRSQAGLAAGDLSARMLVHGLRAGGAKRIGLSTYGGVPSWFPLEAFLEAGVDFAGGQTYTDDNTIDTSIASFVRRVEKAKSSAQIVPNYGLYARGPDGKARSKTMSELIAHTTEFINEGEPVRAAIGWAENFLTLAHERALWDFSQKIASHRIGSWPGLCSALDCAGRAE